MLSWHSYYSHTAASKFKFSSVAIFVDVWTFIGRCMNILNYHVVYAMQGWNFQGERKERISRKSEMIKGNEYFYISKYWVVTLRICMNYTIVLRVKIYAHISIF